MQTKIIKITNDAKNLLDKMASDDRRTLIQEVSIIVENAYHARYEIQSIQEPPRPAGSDHIVPVMIVK